MKSVFLWHYNKINPEKITLLKHLTCKNNNPDYMPIKKVAGGFK
jgi:hypothetical protein